MQPTRPVFRRLSGATATAAVLAVAVAGATGSGAAAVRSDLITVDGTAVVVVVDTFDSSDASESFVSVDVDGILIPVPDTAAAGLESGQAVEVTLDAPADMSTDEAVAAAADDTSGVDVVGVVATEAEAPALQATSPAGAHTLTILPVYWTAPDVTTNQLRTYAADSAAYWSETSGGDMTFTTPVVESWVEIDAPTSCSLSNGAVEDLWDEALAAHGYPYSNLNQPDPDTHVVVYFPDFPECEWLGLAAIGSGQTWINGDMRAEVLAHEMGHNLGLGHANTKTCYAADGTQVPFLLDNPATLADGRCETEEYGDWADLMGNVWGMAPGNLNTALADNLEFVDVVNPPTTGVTTVELAPISDEAGQRAIEIPLSGTRAFFIDYRPNADRDTRQPTWSGVQVHERGYDGSTYSYLLSMDPDGEGSGIAMAVGERYTFLSITGGRWSVVLDSLSAEGAWLRVIPPAGFLDIAVTHPFYADIAWMRHTGISTGTQTASGSYYKATDAVSRGAMAAFLYRSSGSPAFTAPAVSPFVDVPVTHPFYKEIAWLADSGISTGTVTASGTYFKPADSVSRGAMAAFLYRASGSPDFTAPAVSPFKDIATSHPFYAEIAWLADAGISTGTVTAAGTYYKASDAVSRGAMAAFMYRADTWKRQTF